MNLSAFAACASVIAFPPNPARDSVDGLRSALARVPDVNGDGLDDLAVAFRRAPPPRDMEIVDVELLALRSGRILLLSGRDGSLLTSLEGGPGFGAVRAIAGTPDSDGDGAGDLWVSADKGASLYSTSTKKVLAKLAVDLKGDCKTIALDVGADRDGDGRVSRGDRTWA